MTVDRRLPLARLPVAGAAADTRELSPGRDRGAWRARLAAWRRAFVAHGGGDVALHLDDGFEFSAALFAAWSAGATPWLPGDTLPATLARLREAGVTFAGELPGGFAPAADGGSDDSLEELDADACRLVLFTSGSTGTPVAITKTLRQLDAEVAALEAQFGAGLGDACVHATVSHQHIYGLLFRLLWPLSAGRRFAAARLQYNEQIAALGGQGPVVLVASPAHLKRLPENLDWRGFAGGLQAVFSSGGALPGDAAASVQRLWRRPAIEVFGSTETGGIAWRRAGDARTAWQPLPGVAWRQHDGLLEVRSPHLPDAAWFRTADRVRDAGDGAFELLGRADRIVKVEERRISLDAIERRLAASALLQDVRVVALPGPRVLLAVVAVASAAGVQRLAAAGRAALATELRASLAADTDAIALPRRWRFVDALPVDAQGKCSERALLALLRPAMPEPVWHQRTPARAEATLLAGADLAAFDGHFPQAAILPGVVLVDWALRLGREAFGFAGEPVAMETLKFQHLVRPGTELQLQLDRSPGQLAFRFTSVHGVHASGRLRFAAETPA